MRKKTPDADCGKAKENRDHMATSVKRLHPSCNIYLAHDPSTKKWL